ncbi:urease accessory protein UreF [Siculibacillus lacustris]|uniref:Urease accessory protein UreF n=1 Tax=Siculibacillus lacustris TaxID=1549641 RepID=A0A4Q9VG41_9HYPH|nr:urease accessory protein UreF [Siculibacillus lacustris]TBW33951.1 urease accessory protein UreF [Siculibacillus lacustris]
MTDSGGSAATDDGVDDLLTLQVWLSPAFPVGGFSYSHGLEWAIEAGAVTTAAGLAAWLGDVLVHGAGRNDAILLAAAHRATVADDVERLAEVVELAAASQPSRERRLEATAQGAAFVRAIADTWQTPRFAELLDRLAARMAPATPTWTHAVAVGTAAGAHGLALDRVLPAFLQGFAASVISAGVRAVPLGQSDGLRVLRSLGPTLRAVAAAGAGGDLDLLGGAAVLADIASMRHETQYTRLFRS